MSRHLLNKRLVGPQTRSGRCGEDTKLLSLPGIASFEVIQTVFFRIRQRVRNYASRGSREVKVKYTLVQALRLCTGRTAYQGSRGIALPFHDHGTRRVRGQRHAPAAYTREDPVPIVQEAGWAQGPVWTGAENLAPTGIRSPDRPARSQSLYRLRYPAMEAEKWMNNKWAKRQPLTLKRTEGVEDSATKTEIQFNTSRRHRLRCR